jgi:toxin HigB-1
MLDVTRIRSQALKRFARGDASKINPRWLPRIRRILAALNVATHPAALEIPGSTNSGVIERERMP